MTKLFNIIKNFVNQTSCPTIDIIEENISEHIIDHKIPDLTEDEYDFLLKHDTIIKYSQKYNHTNSVNLKYDEKKNKYYHTGWNPIIYIYPLLTSAVITLILSLILHISMGIHQQQTLYLTGFWAVFSLIIALNVKKEFIKTETILTREHDIAKNIAEKSEPYHKLVQQYYRNVDDKNNAYYCNQIYVEQRMRTLKHYEIKKELFKVENNNLANQRVKHLRKQIFKS